MSTIKVEKTKLLLSMCQKKLQIQNTNNISGILLCVAEHLVLKWDYLFYYFYRDTMRDLLFIYTPLGNSQYMSVVILQVGIFIVRRYIPSFVYLVDASLFLFGCNVIQIPFLALMYMYRQ